MIPDRHFNLVEASALPPDQPGQTKYFVLIDPNALSFGPPDGAVRNAQIELATACSTLAGCHCNTIVRALVRNLRKLNINP